MTVSQPLCYTLCIELRGLVQVSFDMDTWDYDISDNKDETEYFRDLARGRLESSTIRKKATTLWELKGFMFDIGKHDKLRYSHTVRIEALKVAREANRLLKLHSTSKERAEALDHLFYLIVFWVESDEILVIDHTVYNFIERKLK